MDDMDKLENLIKNGYRVNEVSVDIVGKAIIHCEFLGVGEPADGRVYFIITEEPAVIEKAKNYAGSFA